MSAGGEGTSLYDEVGNLAKQFIFRQQNENCWAGECFQLSCASEGWSVGEAVQGVSINCLFLKLDLEGKENKRLTEDVW